MLSTGAGAVVAARIAGVDRGPGFADAPLPHEQGTTLPDARMGLVTEDVLAELAKAGALTAAVLRAWWESDPVGLEAALVEAGVLEPEEPSS
jgi:hypothetical protein